MTTLLLALLAALHLAFVGLAAVGPLVIAGLRMVARFRADNDVDGWLYRVGKWSTAAVLIGAGVGLTAGTIRAGVSDAYVDMLQRFGMRAYSMLVAEWVFTIVCYGTWLWLWDRCRQAPRRHALLAIVGATNLLYHFPPMMIAQNMLTIHPELIAESQITRSALLPLLWTPYVAAKTLHVWGAGTVVASVCLLLVTGSSIRSDMAHRFVRWSSTVGLIGIAAQWLSGIAVLLLLAGDQAQRVTGASIAATGVFLIGVLLTIHVMLHMARLALRPTPPLRATGLAVMVFCIMLSMSLAARW